MVCKYEKRLCKHTKSYVDTPVAVFSLKTSIGLLTNFMEKVVSSESEETTFVDKHNSNVIDTGLKVRSVYTSMKQLIYSNDFCQYKALRQEFDSSYQNFTKLKIILSFMHFFKVYNIP